MMFILHVHGRLETRVESFNHDDAWHSRLDTRNTTVAPVFEGLHDVENISYGTHVNTMNLHEIDRYQQTQHMQRSTGRTKIESRSGEFRWPSLSKCFLWYVTSSWPSVLSLAQRAISELSSGGRALPSPEGRKRSRPCSMHFEM